MNPDLLFRTPRARAHEQPWRTAIAGAIALLLTASLVVCRAEPTPVLREEQPGNTAGTRRALVVDENDTPVANADVAFLAKPPVGSIEDPTVDCEPWFAGEPRHRTGADGVVGLPTDLARVAAMARAGERFGAAWLAFDDRSFALPILRIAPDRHVHVLVRGPDHEPRRGVPIEVAPSASRWEEFRGWHRDDVMGTDTEGRLTLWHAQRLCEWDPEHPRLELRAHVIGAASPSLALDLRQPLADPVVLDAPASGQIVVRQWIAKGIPDDALPDVRAWRLADYDGESGDVAFGVSSMARQGEWCSRPVALGNTWRVYVRDQVVDVAGPTRDGEQVGIDVIEPPSPKLGEKRVSATVTLEWPDGTPCANETVHLSDPWYAQVGTTRCVRTDAHGRVGFVALRSGWFEFYVARTNLVANLPMPEATATPGILDLGTLRLRSPRLLAAGRVVDATTHMPVRAKIELRGDLWIPEWQTNADGSFAVWDDPTATSRTGTNLEIEVTPQSCGYPGAFGYVGGKRAFTLGAQDLVLALERTRMLRCTLLVDPHLGTDAIEVACHGTDGGADGWVQGSRRARSGRIDYSWEIPASATDPAQWRLSIAGGDELPPLCTVPGSAFRPNPDGYEVEVDLRGQLAEFDLFAAGLEDMPYQGSFLVRTLGSNEPWRKQVLHRHSTVVARKGTQVEAVICPRRSPCARIVLSEGTTQFTPQPPVFELEFHSPVVADDLLDVDVLRLERQEPWLDEVERGGFQDASKSERLTWPMTKEQIESASSNAVVDFARVGGVQRINVDRLGRYAFVPCLRSKERPTVYFPESAVILEAKVPGEVLRATLRVDPEKVRAALDAK